MKPNLVHTRFYKLNSGHKKIAYDGNNIGLKTIVAMAAFKDNGLGDCIGVSLDGVIVNHHKGDIFGHQVHVAATQEQWQAVKSYWESGAFD